MVLRLFALLVYIFGWCNGHAIFWEPPSRASLGKHNMNFCKVPINNDHMSLYCGGIQAQHQLHGGKCGICGDEYGSPQQPHAYPGKFATGILGRSYFTPGQVIEVIIDVVANHKGFFAFRLCPNNNPQKAPNAKCFSHFPLKLADGESFHFLEPTARMGTRVRLQVKLPDGLECWQCIIQWSYVAGNNWGIGAQTADISTPDCLNNPLGKLGCGPQETFRGCADVCIGPRCPRELCAKAKPFEGGSSQVVETTTTTTTTTTEAAEPIQPPIHQQICIQAAIKNNFYSLIGNEYCIETCQGKPMDVCNLYLCYCTTQWLSTKNF
eukprot:13350.XXX_288045_289393_1 [CDS] Oithona nana genome sequencing.